MASVKEFITRFNIGAVWTGQKGVNQATAALHKTASTAQRVNTHVKGMYRSMVGAVATYDLASRAVSAFTNVLMKSVTAASEAQQVHDDIGLALERNAKKYKNLWGKTGTEQAAVLKENEEALIRQAELLEKTGHDAETALAGWSKIIGTLALSPKQMIEQSKAFSDVLSYMYGANATQEESIELGDAWADMVTRGNIAFAKRLDMSDSEISAIQSVNKARKAGEITQEEAIRRRQAIALEGAQKFAGETERVFGKASGKIAQMWTQIGNIFEELGAPFIERAPALAESFSKMAVAVKPIAEDLAPKISEFLKATADWFATHTNEIIEAINKITWALGKAWDIFLWLQKNSEAIFKPMYEFLRDNLWPIIEKIIKALEYIWSVPSGIPAGTKVTPTVPPAMDWRYGAPASAPAGVYPPGAPAAPATPQGGTGQYYSHITAASTAGSVAALKSERARIAEELASDPKLQQLLMASVKAEVGDQPAETQQAYMESVMNRAAAEKKTLQAILSNPNYYPAATKNKLGRTVGGSEATRLQAMTSQVLGGSNVANYATGNESGSVRSGGAPILAKPKGGYERFVGENWTKDWIARMQRAPQVKPGPTANISTPGPQGDRQTAGSGERMHQMEGAMMKLPGGPGSSLKGMIKEMNLNQRTSGATGGTNVAMNPVINVHGVPAGSEAAIGAAVQKAIQDPNRRLVEQIKSARNYESRLSYV